MITFCIMILGTFLKNVLIITIVLFVSFAGSPDILICGNCREMFSDLVDMMEHKRDYCKLRFTCKCDSLNDETDPSCLECNNSTVPNTQSSNASTNHSKCFFFLRTRKHGCLWQLFFCPSGMRGYVNWSCLE